MGLDYKWRAHDISVGIDNINSWDVDDGFQMTGPGYSWIYGYGDPGAPVFGTNPNVPPYVGPSNQCTIGYDKLEHCYYVEKYVNASSASVKVQQRAQYIEDNWQVTRHAAAIHWVAQRPVHQLRSFRRCLTSS